MPTSTSSHSRSSRRKRRAATSPPDNSKIVYGLLLLLVLGLLVSLGIIATHLVSPPTGSDMATAGATTP